MANRRGRRRFGWVASCHPADFKLATWGRMDSDAARQRLSNAKTMQIAGNRW